MAPPEPPLKESCDVRFEEESVLPLPLTCFEEYLFRDDTPSYPMTLIFRLRFAGFIDASSFETALSIAIKRHPLLRATVCRTRFGGLMWTDHPDWTPIIHWHAKGDENGFPEAHFLDLTSEPGLRIWVLDRDDGHDLVMQIHHCCTDGRGLMSFIEDLLISYAMHQNTPERNFALRDLEPFRLRNRSAPDLRGWKYLKVVLAQVYVLHGIRKFFTRSPVSLSTVQNTPVGESRRLPRIAPIFFTFSAEESKRLVSSAKAFKATLNDLLLRDLFLAVDAWREKKGGGDAADWLRFSIPMDLRETTEEKMPMANSISLVFLDCQKKDFSDRAGLLKSIQNFMATVKRFHQKYTYIFSVGIARFFPGGLARLTRNDKCFATTCFSNVGRVLGRTPLPLSDGRVVAGNVRLDSIDVIAPPLRRHMDATFSVHTYGDRLQLVLNYNSLVIPETDARELLELYVQEIRRTEQESTAL